MRRIISVLTFVVLCSGMVLYVRTWQERAISETRRLNGLLEKGMLADASRTYNLSFGSYAQVGRPEWVLFRGSTILPLTHWGRVEVRLYVKSATGLWAETSTWKLSFGRLNLTAFDVKLVQA
jgi:hypothetical protein